MAKTPLILLTASLLLALTFTISCSENGEDGDPSSSSVNDVNGESSSSIIANGGNNFESDLLTESYALRNVTDDSFEYVEEYEDYRCIEGGNIVKETEENFWKVNYSISNNVLTWENRWDDVLHFAGTSNNLTGTWTRTKNKSTSCELVTLEDEIYWKCKEGWEIVKAEFTTSTVKITSDVCLTEEVDGEEYKGWKYKAIDCNTLELSKGAEKVTERMILSGNYVSSLSFTYNGETCTYKEPTLSQRQNACRDAWNAIQAEDIDSYYLEVLYRYLLEDSDDFGECFERNGFPAGIFGYYGEDDAYGAVSAKPLPRTRERGGNAGSPILLGPL
jgi:hypothetical protein